MLVVVLLVLTVGDAPGTVRATARSSCSDRRPFSAKATKSRVALRSLKSAVSGGPNTIVAGCLPDISRNDASLSAIPASLDALCTKKYGRGRVRVLPVRSGRSKSQRRFPILIVTFSSGYRRATSEGHPFGRRVQIQKGRIAFAAMNHRFEQRQIGDNELPKGCQ